MAHPPMANSGAPPGESVPFFSYPDADGISLAAESVANTSAFSRLNYEDPLLRFQREQKARRLKSWLKMAYVAGFVAVLFFGCFITYQVGELRRDELDRRLLELEHWRNDESGHKRFQAVYRLSPIDDVDVDTIWNKLKEEHKKALARIVSLENATVELFNLTRKEGG